MDYYQQLPQNSKHLQQNDTSFHERLLNLMAFLRSFGYNMPNTIISHPSLLGY